MGKLVTTSIYIDRYHPKADGKCAISIRVTYGGKKKYYPTKYKLTEQEFIAIREPKAKKKDREIFQDLVSLETKAITIINQLKDGFSFTLFEKKYSKNLDDNENIFSLLSDRVKQLENEGRISTSVVSNCALTSLKKFHTKEKLGFDELNVDFLYRYKKWMEADGNSSTTIGMYLREVRTIFNEAVNEGNIPQELYPFRRGQEKNKFVIPTGKNVKKALTLADIAEIYNYIPDTVSEEKARDFWLLSYLANGINIKDIALLKIKNIDGDVIRFKRAKTKRSNEEKPIIITVIITADVRRIINRWGNKTVNPDDYIFPILQKHNTPQEEYKLIQLFTAFVNNNMKKVAEKLELNVSITTYAARHSFSTILKRSGSSVEAISEALGHRDVKTTQNYLAGFEDDQKREMVQELTNFSKLKAV